MKTLNSIRSNLNKSDVAIINSLLNYELKSNKIIRSSCENIHLKILIPCIAAGAIIGKAGEAIAIIQKESGAKVKISKSYDFYPGTTERICLIMGSIDSVTKVHDYIIEKIYEKPEQLIRQIIDGKGVIERHKQVKILVPNSTAGMIIGKSGCYIKEVKEKSGAFVQISQKSKEINLPERCVTIAGDIEQNRIAVSLILGKIAEDPHSASCPSISYVDIVGPVASAYPTGSPYAMISSTYNTTPALLTPPTNLSSTAESLPNGNILEFITSPVQSLGHKSYPNISHPSEFNYFDEDPEFIVERPLSSLRVVRNILRMSGFSDSASDSISRAVETICRYGLINHESSKSAALNGFTKNNFHNINLFDGPPLYGSPNGEDTNSTYPLDFLINSYLNESLSKVQSLNGSYSPISEDICRNIELSKEKLASLGSIDGTFFMNVKLKTNTKIKIIKEVPSKVDNIYSIQISGSDLDNVLEAIGMIIYNQVPCPDTEIFQ